VEFGTRKPVSASEYRVRMKFDWVQRRAGEIREHCMINILFVVFVILMTGVVVVSLTRYLGIRTALATAAGLAPWLIYVGWISYAGVVRNLSRPP